jgi:hypothetical protein
MVLLLQFLRIVIVVFLVVVSTRTDILIHDNASSRNPDILTPSS